MKRNIKTTIFGALTAGGAGMVQSDDPIVKIIGQVVSVIAPILLGYFAADKGVQNG